MKTAMKCAAVASVLMLTAGSAAWAQTYGTNPSSTNPSTPNSYNQGNQGYTTTPGTQGYSNQGTYNANQGTWSSGMQGSSAPNGGQSSSQAGYGMGNITTYQQAEQELTKYGYNGVHDLKSMQGWSADAMRNGERVHVILGDNGLVATFPGSK
jgi:hypothetical protein